VYDKGLLHQLLGVSPKASVVTVDMPANHQIQERSLAGASSVQEAWDEADMVLESDEDRRDRVTKHEDSDETGRYHIRERRPTRQGRSNGTEIFDSLATYTTDEEEEEEELSEDELEHRAYDIESGDERRSRMSRRRSYWLSKGIGPEQASHGDDGESS
jgi:non-canonical poly(A) RNA polymerase PAPD5/7